MSKLTFNGCFSALYDFITKRQNAFISLFLFLTVAAGAGIFYVTFENDIKFMLPDESGVRRSINFLDSSRISNNVVISMKLNSDEIPLSELTGAIKEFSASIDSPLITKVKDIAGASNMGKDANEIIAYAPQLFDKADQERLTQQITGENIKERFALIYRQMLMPGGSFMGAIMLRDPFGVSLSVLSNIEKLSLTLGYDVVFEDGVLLNRDKSHAMVIMETSVPVTDAFLSRKLITYVKEQLSLLPDYVSADIIAGHLHAVDNETILKRDIGLVSITVLLAFFIIFICVFKDMGTLTIFIMPIASVLMAICLTFFIFRQVSYFIAGMAAVITGIAIDYGIHVYSAVRVSGGRSERVKQVAKPIMVGALTTMGVFGGFLFSRVPGYRQLALFSVCGISICLFYSLFILPQILRGKRSRNFEGVSRFIGRGHRHVKKRWVVYFWGIFVLLAALVSGRTVFENDVRQFDGSSKETLAAEDKFHGTWGGGEQPAIFVVTGGSLEEAIVCNEIVYNEVVKSGAEAGFASIATIWPALKTREANLDSWKRFWDASKRDEVVELFKENGALYDFSDKAFSVFLNTLANPAAVKEGVPINSELFENIIERFVNEVDGEYQILSFFPDKDKYIKKFSPIAVNSDRTFIISRKAFSSELSQSISSEILPLSIAAALIIITLTMVFLRDARLTCIALIPVVSAILSITGALALTGTSLNASAAIAALIVCGLCIDYGIFMVYSCRDYGRDEATATAVTLSALTTLIGSGTLLLAKHPILFSIGRTITLGVLAGFLTSFFVVPTVYTLWIEGSKERRGLA